MCIATQGSEVTSPTLSCISTAISPVAVILPYVQQEVTTTLSHVVVEAAAINIRWQKSDFLPATTASATSISSTPRETTPGTAVGPPAPDSGASSLSIAARAGIGAGIAVGILLVFGTVAFILYRRRKHRELEEGTENITEDDKGLGVAADNRPPEAHLGQEVHGQSQQEMPTRDNMLEMNGHSGPTELHAWGRFELESK